MKTAAFFFAMTTPEAWLVTIPSRNFGIGEELSELANQGKKKALELIRAIQLRAGCAAAR